MSDTEAMLRKLNVNDKARLWHTAKAAIDKLEEFYEKKKQEDPAYRQAKELRALLDGILMEELETSGAKNMGTQWGTVHTVTRYSASVLDPADFMQFVINSQLWEMLDKKANVTAVRGWVEEHKTLPPGVKLTANTRLSVTAPKEPL